MTLADQWVDAVRQIVAEALASTPQKITGLQATVTAVAAGAAADGQPMATVTWGGAEFPAAYLASYAPTVGHQVLVLLIDADPVIVGRVVGTPPLT